MKKKYVFLIISIIVIIFIIQLIEYENNKSYYRKSYNDNVEIRRFPYPYVAALSICSDIDNTGSLDEYLEIRNYLSSNEMTRNGKGLGLDIGNSFFFYEDNHKAITYYDNKKIRETIIQDIKNVNIDFLHSYGNKVDFKREDAIKAIEELKKNNLKIKVWVDHYISKDNLGDDVTYGEGDHPDSSSYHSDLTLKYGIKFVWLGRVTMIAGQDVPIKLSTFFTIFDSEHKLDSLINISKEIFKNILGLLGNEKYKMHKGNKLVNISTLNDGQKSITNLFVLIITGKE